MTDWDQVHTTARALLEADLLTGLIGLDRYARKGVPKAIDPRSDAQTDAQNELRSVFETVRPSDLYRPARHAYENLHAAWKAGRPLTGVALPAHVSQYGVGIAFLSRSRAKRLMEMAALEADLRTRLGSVATSVEELRSYSAGVR